jgi:hypothetical protein
VYTISGAKGNKAMTTRTTLTIILGITLGIALVLHFTGHREGAFWVAIATSCVGALYALVVRLKKKAPTQG